MKFFGHLRSLAKVILMGVEGKKNIKLCIIFTGASDCCQVETDY